MQAWSYTRIKFIRNNINSHIQETSVMSGKTDLKDLPEVYCKAWASRDPTGLLALFSEDSFMTDHGAQIHVPFPYLERHHRHWNGAHADFEVWLDEQYPV